MKAIEKAWNQAEQPKEFSIKIFEKEERNFFGMTTKPAKIGIFFSDKPIIHEKPAPKPRPEIKECRSSFASSSHEASKGLRKASKETSADKPVLSSIKASADTSAKKPIQQPVQKSAKPETTTARPASQQKPTQLRSPQEKKQPIEQKPQTSEPKQKRIPAMWNDAMTNSAHTWLNKTLALMNMTSIAFNSEIAGKNLKLTFNMPLITDITHEKQLFRSLAHLIMSSLRNQYKQEIRDLKVILIRPE